MRNLRLKLILSLISIGLALESGSQFLHGVGGNIDRVGRLYDGESIR